MKKIILHVCCAPCATYPVEVLKAEGEVVGFFFNPNIQPQDEYDKRLAETERFFAASGMRLIAPPYNPDVWNDAIKGLENEPEGAKRCEVCFRLRLRAAALEAERQGCGEFTSTLTVSRRKNSKTIHRLGEDMSREIGVLFRKDDFKKRGGGERSVGLSREWGFYRQNYCGCVFSRREPAK